jgi:hypothetical protein
MSLFFLTDVINGSEYHPALLETVGLCMSFEILDTLVCLMLTLNVETVLALDALQRQMPSAVTLIYSVDDRPWLI